MRRPAKRNDNPTTSKRPIEQYDHKGQRRKNNPPVGLVTEATDRDAARKQYAYDPHLDPTLTWAGKAEHTAFEVPMVRGRPRADLDTDRMLQLALTHVVEIVGEAASRVSTQGQARYPDIPWHDAVSTRNRIVHGYDAVTMTLSGGSSPWSSPF